jgi:hypothetical protein
MTRLFSLQSVAFGAKLINLVAHPVKKGFCRRTGNARPLELPYIAALSLHLTQHVLNLGANVVDVRHRSRPSSARALEHNMNIFASRYN